MLAMGGANLKVEVTIQDLAAFGEAIANKVIDAFNEKLAKQEQRAEDTKNVPWLSTAQVCKKLGIGRSTLFGYNQQGIILPVKIGGQNRYNPEDVSKLLTRQGMPAAAVAHPDVMA